MSATTSLRIALLSAIFSVSGFGFQALGVAAENAVEFNYRLPQVGGKSVYDVQFDVDVEATIQRNGQTPSKVRQTLKKNQTREITILKTIADRASKIQIHFLTAREAIARGNDAPSEQTQAIEGKHYLVERVGAGLVITDPQGNAVSDNEKILVAMSTESVGRRNQLARFLHGRSVQIGETLELPKETAAELLGMSQSRGDAQNVAITLAKSSRTDGMHLAEFVTLIGVKMASGASMNIEGKMVIDADTCRMVSAEFTGPISDHSRYEVPAAPPAEGVVPAGHSQPETPQTVETTLQGTLKASIRSR